MSALEEKLEAIIRNATPATLVRHNFGSRSTFLLPEIAKNKVGQLGS